jgi:hypothetical protein
MFNPMFAAVRTVEKTIPSRRKQSPPLASGKEPKHTIAGRAQPPHDGGTVVNEHQSSPRPIARRTNTSAAILASERSV